MLLQIYILKIHKENKSCSLFAHTYVHHTSEKRGGALISTSPKGQQGCICMYSVQYIHNYGQFPPHTKREHSLDKQLFHFLLKQLLFL